MGRVARRWAPLLSVSVHAAALAGLMASHGLAPPVPPVQRIEVSLPPIEEARSTETTPLQEPPPVPEVSEAVVPPPAAEEEPPADPEPPVPETSPPVVPDIVPLPAVPAVAAMVPLPLPKPQPPAPPKQPPAMAARNAVRATSPSPTAPPPPGAAPNTAAPPAPARTAGPPPDYLAALQARLARHKIYPRAAQLAREQGTVLLRFAVARDGRVLSWAIERTSGFASLDRQVETMIERAAPLPPIPASITADQLDIVLPVQFALQ